MQYDNITWLPGNGATLNKQKFRYLFITVCSSYIVTIVF